jgi:hypothetical protein
MAKKQYGITIAEFYSMVLVEAVRRETEVYEPPEPPEETLTEDQQADQILEFAKASAFYQSALSHRAAAEEIVSTNQGTEIFLLAADLRAPLIVRRPTSEQVGEYMIDMETINQDRLDGVQARERAKRVIAADLAYAQKLVVYPKGGLTPGRVSHVVNFASAMLGESIKADSVKIVG